MNKIKFIGIQGYKTDQGIIDINPGDKVWAIHLEIELNGGRRDTISITPVGINCSTGVISFKKKGGS